VFTKDDAYISVVVPVYNEEELIPRLHAEIAEVMNGLGRPWEVVYVNDGSRDATLQLLLAERSSDPHVVVVDLSRNWGHQSALTAGLSTARGGAVILMDGDLQDPPSVIPEMVARWCAGAQVVIAERRRRSEHGLRGLLFWAFYRLLSAISDFPIPINAGIFGLLDRRAVDAVLQLSEGNRYLPGMRSWIGYRTALVVYDRAERGSGEPKQQLRHLLRYACNAIFGFSYKPLRLSLLLGSMTLAVALFLLAMSGLRPGFWGPGGLRDVAPVFSSLFTGGIQLICIGILGEYIGRVYDEVRRRPLYLIQSVYPAGADNPQIDPHENGYSVHMPIYEAPERKPFAGQRTHNVLP